MNHYKQIKPNFSGPKQPLADFDFETLEELLKHPSLVYWKGTPLFSKFSKMNNFLVAEYDNSQRFLVIGEVQDMSALDLPIRKRWF